MNTAVAQNQVDKPIVALFLAFELSSKKWKLGFSIGFGQRPRERTIAAGDLETLQTEIRRAKKRFGIPEDAPVWSCYEIGRDGFWLHRYLTSVGVENLVVSSSSIEVPRQARRKKTDRLDVEKLLTMLMRYHMGDKRVWSVLHVPSVEEEDRRQLHRELNTLKKERTQHQSHQKPAGVSWNSACSEEQLPARARTGASVGWIPASSGAGGASATRVRTHPADRRPDPGTGSSAHRNASP